MERGSLEIKGIVFDKDGVLVDFEKTWINVLFDMAGDLAKGDAALKQRLLSLAGFIEEMDGFAAGSVWAAGTTDDLVAAWSPELKGFTPEQLSTFINDCCLEIKAVPLHGVKPLQALFESLKANGFSLGITTNDLEAAAVKTMDEFGLAGHLSLICGFDSVENPKPAPDPVVAFCDVTGLKAENLVVVGDNVHDLEMAENSGARLAVGVLTGNSTLEELAPHADYVLESVLDLLDLLQRDNI